MATYTPRETLELNTCKDCGVKYKSFVRHYTRCQRAQSRCTFEDITARLEYIYYIFGRISKLSPYASTNAHKHDSYIKQLYVLVELAKHKIGLTTTSCCRLTKGEKKELYKVYNLVDKSFDPPYISMFQDW